MTELNIYTTTFNCGRTPLNIDHFAANFFDALTTNLPPDLVVLSLQEIAPLGYSFLGGSLLTPYFDRFTNAVNLAASEQFEGDEGYESVVVRNLGMTGVMVFARPAIARSIRWIETAGVGTGVWEVGNKGAVGVRVAVEGDGGEEEEELVMSFVAAHLAPMEWDWERRNEDWRSICEGLVFEREDRVTGTESEPLLSSSQKNDDDDDNGSKSGLYSPPSHIFLFGDLNYRTSDQAPEPTSHKTWPHSLSDPKQYTHFLTTDQLTREMHKNKTCHGLAESPITFPPTYKISSATQLAAARRSSDLEARGLPWAKHRVPSWCDRILYLAAAPPRVHAYTALPVQPTCDHRPVALSCSIPRKPLEAEEEAVRPPFGIRRDWREARAAARRYELVVGAAAYLGLTWEGEALLGGSVFGVVGGYLALRAMIGT